MKEPRLRLSRETVRELSHQELEGAAVGGAIITGNTCGCRTGFSLLEGCNPFSFVIELCPSQLAAQPTGCLP